MLLREYLQSTHSISRRKFTDFVDKGQIFLDGNIVESYKQEIQDNEQLIVNSEQYKIHEQIVIKQKKSDSIFVMFNKPVGYVASKSDPHNQTIYELLPPEFQGFYYIGRLDKDSHGLLLLTNDPKLVHEFEHPKFEIEKEYVVKIKGFFNSRDAQKMEDGIMDEGELLKIKRLHIIDHGVKDICTLNIILNEGKKRHIRRICKALGYKVLDLQRIREGEYVLGNLKLNEWRVL